jgi:hypothetical protein
MEGLREERNQAIAEFRDSISEHELALELIGTEMEEVFICIYICIYMYIYVYICIYMYI